MHFKTPPAWVNWLAGLQAAFRLLYWAVYYSGVGKAEAGPRTIVYVLGFLANAVLAIAALLAFLR